MRRVIRWILASALVGCGGKQAEPSTPSVPVDAGAEPAAIAAPEGGPMDSGAAGPEAPDAEAAPAASSVANAPRPEPIIVDPCGPVGTAFEKSVRPQLKACYREAKKKKPNLEGSIKIVIDVSTVGKVAVRVPEKSDLGPEVTACMIKAVKAAPLETRDCMGKLITIPMQFPTK